MLHRVLFDNRRRNEMQDAIRKGEVGRLLSRQRIAQEPPYGTQAGKWESLTLGMALAIGGFSFRYMGVENDLAVVCVETPYRYNQERFILLETGKTLDVEAETELGKTKFQLSAALLNERALDGSAAQVVGVRVREMGGG